MSTWWLVRSSTTCGAWRGPGAEAVVLRLPWSAIRDELGFSSVGAAQLAVKSHEQRNPPRTPDGARRSANETLELFLSGIVGQFIRATDRGDETAAMLADKGRVLVAEQAVLNAAYIP